MTWGPLAVVVAALLGLVACQRASDAPSSGGPPKPLVIATFYPLYEFARQVGGDDVEVVALVPPGVEPHHWEPTPFELTRLQRARVFVYNGAGLEPWVDRLLGETLSKETMVVRATHELPLAVADLSPHHGHRHDARAPRPADRALDPHVWLDPRLAAAQVDVIAAALARVDPARATTYTENARRYAAALDTLHQAFESGLATCARRDFVVSHAAFGYLARRYGLTQVPVMGLSPEAEPTPAEMARVVRFMRHRHVTHVFSQPLVSPKLAETLAREARVATLMLNPVEALTPDETAAGQSYLTVMQANLANLRLGLGCR